jgi:hypothetical protein
MLVENINCYVSDCAEEICSTYVADSMQSVNMLKNNIEMDIKEMALMIARSEKLINI